MASRATQLRALGQSVWLDYIDRGMLQSGEFDHLVRDAGVVGVTSNPTIFQQAVAKGDTYDPAIRAGVAAGLSGEALFERLAVEDIRGACDRLRPLFDETRGLDGRVSIEVSPRLAGDTAGTLDQARRLHREVSRPNLYVKIPATAAGLPAIRAALAEGICINVTLIFSLARYAEVMDAYLGGLEDRVAKDLPIGELRSVASFFVSRVDSKVDKAIDEAIAKRDPSSPERRELEGLRGKAAIANARLAYQEFLKVFRGDRFLALKERGAHLQRPLWASTSTKNPAYPDTLYVDELIGADTVNTMPQATLVAYNDHGRLESAIERDVEAARALMRRLPELGIPVGALIDQLEAEGVAAFAKSYDALLETLESRRRSLHGHRWVKARFATGDAAPAIRARTEQLERERFMERLFAKDDRLWGDEPGHREVARNRLGWLDAPSHMRSEVQGLRAFAAEARRDGFRAAVLLGMGGSSLAPEVFRQAFGPSADGIPLTVLDSTSPAAVRAIARDHDPKKTLFIVSSKSGTTVEVLSFEKHFFEWVHQAAGGAAGKSFVAITDPGTPLERLAHERGYRRVFLNPPDIGGRYSALSFFGLVPAALLGVDLAALLEHAHDEAKASAQDVKATENIALELGATLGELARVGRDKVTVVTGPEIRSLGDWIEQLVAESTGKDGKGLIPVVGEPLGPPDLYGSDRVFVACYSKPLARETEAGLDALERAGHPVLRWRIPELTSFGAEFLRWEIATTVAAAILGVDPFDEPNVTEAKQATRAALDRIVDGGASMALPPLASLAGVEARAPAPVADALRPRVDGLKDPAAWGAALLTLVRPGDYFAVLAYLHDTESRRETLERLRVAVRSATRAATTLGFGPRFLHSTGQLHKGGPPSGIFLQLTADEGEEITIPAERYGFGALIRAQAAGDLQVLERRGRRVVSLHLGANPDRSLEELATAMATARAATE